jgi:hypothetical protein
MSTPNLPPQAQPPQTGPAPTPPGPTPVTLTQNPSGRFAGAPTWLCRFSVLVDMPNTMSINDMEGAIAGALAAALGNLGLPGNVSCTLQATAGGQTLLHPTPPLDVSKGPPVTPSPV